MYRFDTSKMTTHTRVGRIETTHRRAVTEVATRSGVLELAVLGLLHDTPMHGYELRKRLNAILGWGRTLSYGSLYPCLKQMLAAGLITEDVLVAVATTPGAIGDRVPTTRAGRRGKIVYKLTP